jgi:signal transduction histidine kinase
LASSAQTLKYAAVVAAGFALGMAAGWNRLAERIDNYVYDLVTQRLQGNERASQTAVVAIDEATLKARGGQRFYRSILAEALDAIAQSQPKAVAIDVILADSGDAAENARLEAAMRATRNLILSCGLAGDKWDDPLPRFKELARAVGEVELEPDRLDNVGRQISLERIAQRDRRWALSLEAFRIAQGAEIVESPEDLQVGSTVIPSPREAGRPLRIRYLPAGIPTVSVLEIHNHREMLRGKVVFLGVTDLSAARDRLLNPLQQDVAGVAVHAHAFETLARGAFLTPARGSTLVALCLALAVAAGLIFGLLPPWAAYLAAAVLLAEATYWLPAQFFARGVVLPYVAPVAAAWLTSIGAATYQHFFVRRQLLRTESEKSRYQQAIHWAAHEMRTPLTSIQGSSEIMARYNLPEAKRVQLSEMINSESKRLSRIIQTFLDVERLAEGEMELKREPFQASEIVDACLLRVTPIAGRKRIAISLDNTVEGTLTGDRELMEYAFYNLLTNAVKYSPADTEVHVTSELRNGELRLAVRDQGIGMDAKEQKQIFKKFYRTKRAEASGEVGTGIGLSIVDQIVTHHGGRIDVASEPGKGSCFTMVLRT